MTPKLIAVFEHKDGYTGFDESGQQWFLSVAWFGINKWEKVGDPLPHDAATTEFHARYAKGVDSYFKAQP